MKIPKPAYEILNRLNKSGYEAYLVGGRVRDGLTGRDSGDIDITTSALPGQVQALFSDCKTARTGIKHGTVTVFWDDIPAEITTFRTESAYSDLRHPDSVNFTDKLSRDLSRRDFTMNALCADKNGEITDLFGGEADIKNRVIKCIGDPDERFSEDRLRILRAVRFAAVLGFEIEQKTADSLLKNREKLKSIAAERIYAELSKALCGDGIQKVLVDYADIFTRVIPELEPMRNFRQKNPHHIYDVYTHTAIAVQSTPPKPLLRLAALLHDVGKPSTFFTDESGVGHFYGHSAKGAEIAREIMKRLKTSNRDRDYVVNAVKYHDVQIEPTEKAVRKLIAKHGADFAKDLISLKRADNRRQNTRLYDRTEYYDRIDALIDGVIESRRCLSLKNLAVNGADLMRAGIPRGKKLGDILNILLANVIEGNLPNEKSRLVKKATEIYNEG